MGIKYHYDLIQGTPDWLQARCGLLTASEMEKCITPAKLAVANNDKSRTHVFELAAQRVNQYVEPSYMSYDMERGVIDEIEARELYSARYSPVQQCGFITNDKWGFTLGMSPDGLVNAADGFEETDGQIEVKSRSQKYQFETIVSDVMPTDYLIQVQTGLLVTGRDWCDFISFCSGMPMFTKRVHADSKVQAAILDAAEIFEKQIAAAVAVFQHRIGDESARFIPTERRPQPEEIS